MNNSVFAKPGQFDKSSNPLEVEMNGGGNGKFQYADYLATLNGGKVFPGSVFAKGNVSNNPYSGFQKNIPEIGYKNVLDNGIALNASMQNGVPVDMGQTYRGPAINESRYNFGMNIPF